MVDARRYHSVPPHVLDRQRTGPGRHLSRPGYLDHRAGKRVGSRGRSPAHRRKWRRHQRRGGKPFVFNQPTPRFRGVIAVAATADKDLRANLQTTPNMPARNQSESEPLHDHHPVGNRSVELSHRRTTPVGRPYRHGL